MASVENNITKNYEITSKGKIILVEKTFSNNKKNPDKIKRINLGSKKEFSIYENYANNIFYNAYMGFENELGKPVMGTIKSPQPILGFTIMDNIQANILNNFSNQLELYKSILFSIFVSPILFEIGNITEKLNTKYKLILGGGLILRLYFFKYHTKDIDLKLYPNSKDEYIFEDAKQEIILHFERICKRLNENIFKIKDKHNQFIDELKKIYILEDENIIDTYEFIFKNFSELTEFKFVESRSNPYLYKLILVYNDSFSLALLDFNFYNNYDTLNNHILRNLRKQPSHLPLTNKVYYHLNVNKPNLTYSSRFYINIPTIEYLTEEKIILHEDIIGDNIYNSDLTDSKKAYLVDKFKKHYDLVSNPQPSYDFTYLKKYIKYKSKYLKLKEIN